MRCPSAGEILDGLRSNLSEDRQQGLFSHIGECHRCSGERAWLQKVLAATASGPLPEPPEPLLERAFAIVPPRPQPASTQRRGWSLITLLRDSLTDPIPAGVRASGVAAGRRLLYRADDADLDLDIQESAGGQFRITGQLLVPGAPAPDDLFAILWSDGDPVARAEVERFGLFVFTGVPAGTYRFEVWVPSEGRGVRVEPLEVG